METFHLKPTPEERERWERRLNECKPWWIHFDVMVTRVFCDRAHAASVIQADYGISWAGVGVSHRPRQLPTDDPEILCYEFEAPIEVMAVEEDFMKGWMHVIRTNGYHGWYRKCGTETRYRF